jgi:hypothetical protein
LMPHRASPILQSVKILVVELKKVCNPPFMRVVSKPRPFGSLSSPVAGMS